MKQYKNVKEFSNFNIHFFSRVDAVLHNTELLCVVLVMGVWEGREAGGGEDYGRHPARFRL